MSNYYSLTEVDWQKLFDKTVGTKGVSLEKEDLTLIQNCIHSHLAKTKYSTVLMDNRQYNPNMYPGLPHHVNKKFLEANGLDPKEDNLTWYASLPLTNRNKDSNTAGVRRMIFEISAFYEFDEIEDETARIHTVKSVSKGGTIQALIFAPGHYGAKGQKEAYYFIVNHPFFMAVVGDDESETDFAKVLADAKADLSD